MPTVTLTIPEEVKASLKRLVWVNWSEISREEFIKEQQNLEAYEKFKRIVSKSKLTEEDTKRLADEVNKSMHERYKKLYPSLK